MLSILRPLALVCLFAVGCAEPVEGTPTVGTDAAAAEGGTTADGAIDAGGDSAAIDGGGTLAPVRELWFEDVTEMLGVDVTRTFGQSVREPADNLAGGVCVIDVDGVPPLDLFVPLRFHQSSRLLVGSAPLSYQEEAASRGLASVGDATACLAFDMEGDGDDDLLVTGPGTLSLFENVAGQFMKRPELLPGVGTKAVYGMASAADLDGDGDLDLVVAGYYDGLDPMTYMTMGGEPNLLLLRKD
ncbi:MAG: VCBS repeat-containing protein, partial [Myxococcales bacterium]|nr:VCBS repeat-containing protein [Myxococcales bacterium]